MTFWALGGLINGLASSIFGFFVYLRNPKSSSNKIWTFFSLAIAFWSYSYFLWQISVEKTHALFWSRCLMAGAIFIPVTFLHFLLMWLKLYHAKKRILAISYGISFIAFILNFTPYFVKDVAPILWFRFWPQAGIAHLPFLVFWAWLILYCWFIMLKAMRISSPSRRNQIKYVLLGAIIGFSGGFTNYPLWYGIKIPPYGNVLVSVYVGLMAYAIVKYRLMDIKIAITRAGIFMFVYAFVLGLPFWFGFKTGLWLWAIVLMGLLATNGPFIYSYLRRQAEGVLLKEQKRYQKTLKDFSSTLIFIKDIEKLAQRVVFKIMESVKLNFCAIYLEQNKRFDLTYYESNNSLKLPSTISSESEFIISVKNTNTPLLAEYIPKIGNINLTLVLPLFIKQEFFGFIILGEKEKGLFFTDTDLDVFTILSNQTSLALSEIHYFNEYQKATEERYKLIVEKERLESAFQISEAYRHELGNVINIISCALVNLTWDDKFQPTKEDIESAAESIGNNVERARNIFNTVSKYNEHSQSEFKLIELDKLLKDKIDEHKDSMSKGNIILKPRIENNMKVLANDNLSDAFKYMIEGALRAVEYYQPEEKFISVSLKKNNNSAILEISDTAKDVTIDKAYKGVGIERGKEGGIFYFIARRIIFDHKGSFKMESFRDGGGTSFIISLPLEEA